MIYSLSSIMTLQRSPSSPNGRTRTLAERTVVIGLFDAYADLLTERQRVLVRMYYHDDLSLGEIAERRRITRQAVFDALRRAVAEMQRLEGHLGVAAGRERAARARAEADAHLAALEHGLARLGAHNGADVASLRRVLGALRDSL
ncbi:MAG TPA: sigma factor-like helix-turn-helix DNA-binding protein [bacterium]|nr:sigma factor-like helix-turn-helix DNA-binding protein [bacterium]